MVANHRRTLRPGTEFAKHFPLGNLIGTDPIVVTRGDTFDTIREMGKLIRQYQSDTATLAPTLRGATLRDTCRNIWQFAYQHFQYRQDKQGVEQLRRPLRAWRERTAGIDCDCYSILISTILLNLGIAHKLRKTKYQNRPEYQHIYVVVPTGRGESYYTLDPVVDAFDKEEPFTDNYDLPMMPIQVLNGLHDVPAPPRAPRRPRPLMPFGAEFLPLELRLSSVGLGALATDGGSQADAATVNEVATTLGTTTGEAAAYVAQVNTISAGLLQGIHDNLVNSRAQILRTKSVELYPFSDAIARVLNVWENPIERDRVIAELAATGQDHGKVSALGVPTAAPAPAPALNGLFDSVGDFFSDVGHAVGQATQWVGNQASTAAHAVGQAASWVGNGVASGASAAWSGIAQAGSWVGTTVANGASAAWAGIKQASSWVATQAVAIGKLILKYNPLSILIRAGMRVAFRVNLFYMSERFAIGYATDAQAKAANLDPAQFAKAKDRLGSLQSLWKGIQGDPDILRSDILHGYNNASKPMRVPGLGGVASPGLGEPATAVSTAAASGFIATALNWLRQVDWKALFKTASTVATALASKFAKTPTPTEAYRSPLTEQEYVANQKKYDNPPQSGVSPVLLAGGAGLAAWLLLS